MGPGQGSLSIYLLYSSMDIGQMSSICSQIYKASKLTQANYNSRVTSEVSLFWGGAVGARLIHASDHARLDGGGLTKLLPWASDLFSIQVGGDFLPRGAGLCMYRTNPCKVLALPTMNFTCSLCILPCHCASQVVMNLGPVM